MTVTGADQRPLPAGAEPTGVRVAVPVPVRRVFDYVSATPLVPGCRVLVPFGPHRKIGLVVETFRVVDGTSRPLKAALAVLDPAPVVDAVTLGVMRWATGYYAAPPGQMLGFLPARLRTETAVSVSQQPCWAVAPGAEETAVRGTRQRALLAALGAAAWPCPAPELDAIVGKGWLPAAKALLARGLVVQTQHAAPPAIPSVLREIVPEAAQQAAVAAITQALGRFAVFLLEGVTGSGKTEVYLLAVREALRRQLQVLVLVPEIGLTPQTVDRFRAALATPVVALHSGLTERERVDSWWWARHGQAGVLIGTRSTELTEMPRLGLVIVDEEYDTSFKQEESGMRYSARDVALMRAKMAGIRVVLGSATPSLESLQHALAGRYQHLLLTQRAQGARIPEIQIIDLNQVPTLDEGLAPLLITAMQERLQRDEQVVIFLNRRGYAPVVVCRDCGWSSACPHCDARLVWHKQAGELRCHYCGHRRRLPAACPGCHSPSGLRPVGDGTQRVEACLRELFPEYALVRMDRDAIRTRNDLERAVTRVRDRQARILVGTQRVAKGHDFQGVTLVGVLNIDGQLYNVDFRAIERLGQTLIQVAGRAGRGDKPGLVMIQTQFPQHPVLQVVSHGGGGYRGIARAELAQRRAAGFPPFAFLAVVTAHSKDPGAAMRFLQAARDRLAPPAGVELHGPLPPFMERVRDEYHAQLIARAGHRPPLWRH